MVRGFFDLRPYLLAGWERCWTFLGIERIWSAKNSNLAPLGGEGRNSADPKVARGAGGG